MQFKTDKRSLKTRKAIKLAFFKLLKCKDVSDINITEITKSAGINRNSFYTHYKSVGNILDDINNDISSFIEGIFEKYPYSIMTTNPHPVITEFSKMLLSNNFIAEYLIFSKSSNELVRKLKNSICEKFYQTYLKSVSEEDLTVKFIIAYIISGVFEMYYVWFTEGKKTPLNEVEKRISKLILTGTASA